MLSDAVSATKLAQEFYGMLNAGDCQSERAESRRLARYGIDAKRLREELFYLRAFAVYYSMCVTLGASPMGIALRTAFMGIWDEAARIDPEKMDAYNAFFQRIHLYAEAVGAGGSQMTGEFIDRISRAFAQLLDAGQ
ncbi:MAG: hypothetical protein HYU75_18320, partial [Betaproteobacteria bacterium]|nr:hypothetical protein [Betaproteobacteria bacterium]